VLAKWKSFMRVDLKINKNIIYPMKSPFAFGETPIAIDVKTIIHLGITKWKM
jgi:hypothetical protein